MHVCLVIIHCQLLHCTVCFSKETLLKEKSSLNQFIALFCYWSQGAVSRRKNVTISQLIQHKPNSEPTANVVGVGHSGLL